MNHWRKFDTVDALLDVLEQEIPTTRVSTQSGCPLPKGESCEEVAWCRDWPQFAAMRFVTTMPVPNLALLKHFRNWLHLSGFSSAGRMVYGYAARLVFSLTHGTDWRHLPDDAVPLARDEIMNARLTTRLEQHLLDGLSRFEMYLAIRRARSLLPVSKRMGLAWPSTDLGLADFAACWGNEPAQDSETSGCVSTKSNVGVRRSHIKTSSLPRLVREALKPSGLKMLPVRQWSHSNQSFYQQFRSWLHASGYGPSSLFLYGLAARLAFSLVVTEWHHWDVGGDMASVRDWITQNYNSEGTRYTYLKGLDKLAQYLQRRQARSLRVEGMPNRVSMLSQQRPVEATPSQRQALSVTLLESLSAYFAHCQRNWARNRLTETGKT